MPGMENVKVFGRDDMDRMLKDGGGKERERERAFSYDSRKSAL